MAAVLTEIVLYLLHTIYSAGDPGLNYGLGSGASAGGGVLGGA